MFLVPSKLIYYVIFVVIYLSILCESGPNRKDYYINTNFTKILSYKLIFTPNFENKTFKLKCVWTVKTSKYINDVQFYSKNLYIKYAATKLTKSSRCTTKSKREDNAQYHESERRPGLTDINKFSYKGLYPPGNYHLEFNEVTGSLRNNLQGFYYDEYFDEKGVRMPYLITQFGPIGARYAFPSLDEPKHRAIFKIIINRPNAYSCVISNSHHKTNTLYFNTTKDIFEDTEKISPSSVTFLVSKFQISEIAGTIHKIVARPEIIRSKKHEYVGTLINQIYKEVQNFLLIDCEQESLYHVAIPSNKMKFESLGTYRGVNHYIERVLIFSNQSSIDIQQSSTIAIAKLIAQQWFLSYLMVDRWKSVWINEGLTMYLSYNVTAKLNPAWKIKERLASEIRISMQDDSGCCCSPLNEEVQKPFEIEEMFNRVTVYKGAALINMLEIILPQNVLKEALSNLIKTKKWSTYNSTDLYEEIETISKFGNSSKEFKLLPKKLSAIMSPWENQVGYPIITVTRSYSTYITEYISVLQRPYRLDGKHSKDVWSIPINFASTYSPNFENTKPTTWLETYKGRIKVPQLRLTDWFILNNQATYYYRVQYDDKNWDSIGRALMENPTAIHYLNRMQIIDDIFSFADVGMIKYLIAFKISRYLKNEREYAPLKAMKESHQLIHYKLVGSTAYETFRDFITSTVEHVYEAIKTDIQTNDSPPPNPSRQRQLLTFEMLLSWLCDLKSKKCEMLHKLDDNLRAPLLGNFEKYALCSTMRNANTSHWNQVFDQYKSSFKSNKFLNNIQALGCNEDSALQEKFLIYIMESEKDKLIVVIKSILQQNHNGVDLVMKYINPLFSDLFNISTNKDINAIFKNLGSRVTTEKQLDTLITFSKKYPNYNYLIKSPLSMARKNIEWRKKHLRGFENNFNNPKSIGTKHYSSALVFVLIISYYAN